MAQQRVGTGVPGDEAHEQRRSRISTSCWWIRGSVDMYEEYDDGSGGSSLGRKIALGVGVLAVVVLGWFVVTNLTGGKDGGQVKQGAPTASSEATSTSAAA